MTEGGAGLRPGAEADGGTLPPADAGPRDAAGGPRGAPGAHRLHGRTDRAVAGAGRRGAEAPRP